MSYKNLLFISRLAAALMCVAIFSSCNSEANEETLVNNANLAIKRFALSQDLRNPGLDSIFFTVDLNNRVIYNADSLRKGTPIDKLIPVITFAGEVGGAEIVMTGGKTREGTVDYQKNPNDSIDFTGSVVLNVKGVDNDAAISYRLKVNVHQIEPDTLIWSDVANIGFSTRLANPRAMKSVSLPDDKVLCLIEENDGSFSCSDPLDLNDFNWSVRRLDLPFEGVVQSLVSTDESLYMLDKSGNLWSGSFDLSQWNDTGEDWSSIIGPYRNSVVGLTYADGSYRYAQYPRLDLNVKEVDPAFPVSGCSNLVTLSNKWTLSPVAFFVGGVDSQGNAVDATWAFDGSEWVCLNQGGLPALEGASLISYYNYRPSAAGDSMVEYKVWFLVGGRLHDGTLNRVVYISYDNGVNWIRGVNSLQLPPEIPSMAYCDSFVVDVEKSSDLSDHWKSTAKAPARIPNWTDGNTVYWNCPYIYLVGGYAPDGSLYTKAWRGVLNRLTLSPII